MSAIEAVPDPRPWRWLFAYPDRTGEEWKEPELKKLGRVNADGSYIGGAIISLIRVMDHLRRRGHHVDLDVPTAGPPDVLICCREACLLERYPDLEAGRRLLWLHDIDRRRELERNASAFDGAITVSPFLSDLYRDVAPPLLSSTNPLEPADVAEKRPGHLSLAFAGMFIPERGVDFAIRVLARLQRQFPDARLELYGSYSLWMHPSGIDRLHCHHSYAPHVAAAIDELSEPESVRFRGNIANIELLSELARHHFLLVPADVDESCSMVSIEAQSVGTVVMASRRGALPDTVGDGGETLPLDEDLWAERIAAIYGGDYSSRSRAAERHFHRRFRMDENVDAWIRFIDDLPPGGAR